MLSADETKRLLKEGPSVSFVRNILFGDDCWLFHQRGIPRVDTTYQTLKNDVAHALDINPKEVSLIGSGKLGFSVAPGKLFREFRKGRSDLDLAIVSSRMFEEVWKQLLVAHWRGFTQHADDHSKQVFCRYIVLRSDIQYKTTMLQDLNLKLTRLGKSVNDNIRIKHDVNYRIYADWASAEVYHVEGLERVKKEIADGDG